MFPDVLSYFANCISYAILGAILGLTVDSWAENFQNEYQIRPLIMLVIQPLIMITILYILENYVSSNFANDWQANTKGLFFVFLYFGLQSNVYRNFRKLGSYDSP